LPAYFPKWDPLLGAYRLRPPSRELPQDRRNVVAALLARWKDDGWL